MKKMRRIIPAFAMLMVAAIMLSTASFAWFTMSTEVTATGMQLQAKADSTLVISEAPLTFDSGLPEVKFDSTVNKLYPITYGEYLANEGDTEATKGWVSPTNTAGINTATGAMVEGDTWKHVEITTGDNGNVGTYYIERDLYIASAGAAMSEKTITFTLSALAADSGAASKAYAVAIYYIPATIKTTNEDNTEVTSANPLWADDAELPVDMEPTEIIYVDRAENRNTVTLEGKYDIPSIIGVGEQNELTTGLKFYIRFFVDGNLESVGADYETITVGYKYTVASGDYNEKVQYYVVDTEDYDEVANPVEADIGNYYVLDDEADTYVKADAFVDGTTYFTKAVTYTVAVPTPGMTTIPEGWYTRSADTQQVNYKYIRTDDVPNIASQLELRIQTGD